MLPLLISPPLTHTPPLPHPSPAHAALRTMRESILQGPAAHHAFVQAFLDRQFPPPAGQVPSWVRDALAEAGVPIRPEAAALLE